MVDDTNVSDASPAEADTLPSETTTQPGADQVTPAAEAPSQSDTSGTTSPATEPNPSDPTDAGQSQEPIPWQKRFTDVQAHSQRQYHQLQELQQRLKTYDGIDPDAARKSLQVQQRVAQEQALKDWHPKSPNYGKTKASYDRVSSFIKARDALGNEVPQESLNRLATTFGLTKQDIDLHREIEGDRHAQQERLATDPEAYLDEFIQPRIAAALREFTEYQEVKASTSQWFQDPTNANLVQRYSQDMQAMMDPNVPARDKAISFAQAKAQLEDQAAEITRLKAKLGGELEHVATANAQSAALQDRAAVRRDGRSTQAIDPIQVLAKRGITPDHPNFGIELQRLNAKRT